MERDWEHRHAAIRVAPEAVRAAVASHVGSRPIRASAPLPGGKVNLLVRLDLADPDERLALRVYLEDADAAAKEAAVLARVAPSIPVPRVLDSGTIEVAGEKRPWLLLSWVEGTSLDRRFPVDGPEVLARAGRETGAALAAVHAERRSALGFLDAHLEVRDPLGSLPDVWVGYLEQQLALPTVGRRLGPERTHALAALLADGGNALAPLDGHYALLHADCKPVNVLATDDGTVRGLLDWEFAWSGPPLFDWGQMRRWPLPPAFENAMVAGYRDAGGALEGPWRRQARLLDLMNLVGFLGGADRGPRLVHDVVGLVDGTLAALTPGA